MSENSFLNELISVQKDDSPDWLRSVRAEGKSQFEKLGFPTARRGNEDWKYTDVSSLSKTTFNLPQRKVENEQDCGQIQRMLLSNQNDYNLCFMNGSFNKSLSSLPEDDSSLIAGPLSEATTEYGEFLREFLGGIAQYNDNSFTALNTGFIRDGAFLKIPCDTSITEPIYLHYLSDPGMSPTMSHPRTLISVGRGSTATIVENYIGIGNCEYLTNSVAEIFLEPGSQLNYYRVQQDNAQAYHISSTTVLQDNDSTLRITTVDLGGKLVRNQFNILMSGKGSSCDLKGLFYAKGKQHMDNQIFIDHKNSDTTSRELFKGVLDDQSHGVFHGSITVRPGVARADAQQNDKNLLLSPQAKMSTKPAFWIYSNDVKCSHGATCSTFDDDSMFYLHSRGLNSVSAKKLLINGFVSEILDTVQDEKVKDRLYKVISAKLSNLDER